MTPCAEVNRFGAAYCEVELGMWALPAARTAAAVQCELQQLEEQCPQLNSLSPQP